MSLQSQKVKVKVILKTVRFETSLLYFVVRLTLAEYHEQEEIFKLRLGHLKKVK